jgi:Tfp pilus assembly protein PilX
MNFKNLILLAGAIAFASACEGPECAERQLAELSNEGDSNKMAESAEEESNELAEKRNCNAVNPKICSRCRGAGARRATRYKQIVAWRNAQNRAVSTWWTAQMKWRAAKLGYWSGTWWRARVAQYNRRKVYIAKKTAAWIKDMWYRYNHCK